MDSERVSLFVPVPRSLQARLKAIAATQEVILAELVTAVLSDFAVRSNSSTPAAQ